MKDLASTLGLDLVLLCLAFLISLVSSEYFFLVWITTLFLVVLKTIYNSLILVIASKEAAFCFWEWIFFMWCMLRKDEKIIIVVLMQANSFWEREGLEILGVLYTCVCARACVRERERKNILSILMPSVAPLRLFRWYFYIFRLEFSPVQTCISSYSLVLFTGT